MTSQKWLAELRATDLLSNNLVLHQLDFNTSREAEKSSAEEGKVDCSQHSPCRGSEKSCSRRTALPAIVEKVPPAPICVYEGRMGYTLQC